MNKLSPVLCCILAMLTLVPYTSVKIYADETIATTDNIAETNVGGPTWKYHGRVAVDHRQRNASWYFKFLTASGTPCSAISFFRSDAAGDNPDHGAEIRVDVEDGKQKRQYCIKGDPKSGDRELSLVVTADCSDSVLCEIGRTTPLVIFRLPANCIDRISAETSSSGVEFLWTTCISLADNSDERNELHAHTAKTSAELDSLLNSEPKGHQGRWIYLDRDTDPRMLNVGGRYTLALTANDEGGYDIYYCDGARVAASKWNYGQFKGRLLPTTFIDHYNLVWIDASGRPIESEASADFINGSILRLNFPLYKSSVRFAKE